MFTGHRAAVRGRRHGPRGLGFGALHVYRPLAVLGLGIGVSIRLVVGQRSRIRNRVPGLLQFFHFRQHRVE